ncbi:MAG: hypothetical protein K2Y32_07585 [Candidatus Obscuribacterales bacterium]|nr:hypothetical protein [Candidatus Obscuribacterales bacterium]
MSKGPDRKNTKPNLASSGLALLLIMGWVCAVPQAQCRRAYSSYGDVDEKVLDEILHGKRQSKGNKAKEPSRKSRRKPDKALEQSSSVNSESGTIQVTSLKGKSKKASSGSEAQLLARLSAIQPMTPPNSVQIQKLKTAK